MFLFYSSTDFLSFVSVSILKLIITFFVAGLAFCTACRKKHKGKLEVATWLRDQEDQPKSDCDESSDWR